MKSNVHDGKSGVEVDRRRGFFGADASTTQKHRAARKGATPTFRYKIPLTTHLRWPRLLMRSQADADLESATDALTFRRGCSQSVRALPFILRASHSPAQDARSPPKYLDSLRWSIFLVVIHYSAFILLSSLGPHLLNIPLLCH